MKNRHVSPRPTDQDLLVSTLIQAILDLEVRLRRTPTRGEILDYLFTGSRDDPEARALEGKLEGILRQLLDDWGEMDEWAR